MLWKQEVGGSNPLAPTVEFIAGHPINKELLNTLAFLYNFLNYPENPQNTSSIVFYLSLFNNNF